MTRIGEYIIMETLDETRNSIVYRCRKDGSKDPVIIKALRAQFPTPTDIARFKQEFEIIKNISLPGMIKAYEMFATEEGFFLVMEDFNGISLSQILKTETLTLNRFLELGIRLSEILGYLHLADIIHRDIKPANILINPDTREVKLTDFGISKILTHEDADIYDSAVMQGTLVYMSPEQTGRLNRVADYRTDLYSLGITFYEMLTGDVPFKYSDPIEIIYSHIAVRPMPPHEKNTRIPQVVSDIIMRLLRKSPEERFQNGFGVQADLRECLTLLEKHRDIPSFPLATRDISNRFITPQKLTGRESEVSQLLENFERASIGPCEIMLVNGPPGIGKSAVINEIQKSILAKRGYFVSGKYEELLKDRPYSAIIQAFQGLIKTLLSESDEHIAVWKTKILDALGNNGKLITDIIGEVELIIGKQPEVPELSPKESRNRFNLVLENFIHAFASASHPLTLFLDDLQWADIASLELIKRLAVRNDSRNLFLVCSYRDTEVDAAHPLMLTINDIKRENGIVSEMHLDPLKEHHIVELLAGFLRCQDETEMQGLAAIIHSKTQGNPFFINQLIQSMYSEKMITPDPDKGWRSDMARIRTLQVTDNVVALMAEKIVRFSAVAQDLIKLCAAIGSRFEIETLSHLKGMSMEEILGHLTIFIQEGYIGFSVEKDSYIFQHDRIQEAAYSLIEPEELPKIHYALGRLSQQTETQEQHHRTLFYTTDHLNLGREIVVRKKEHIELARLNLEAGKMAKSATAYVTAQKYLTIALELLDEDMWEKEYALTCDIYMENIEVSNLVGDYDRTVSLSAIALENTKTLLDKINVYSAQIVTAVAKEDFSSALSLGIQANEVMGEADIDPQKIPQRYRSLRRALLNKTDDDILGLPDMTDPLKLKGLEYGTVLGFVVFSIAPEIFELGVYRNIRESLKYGLAPQHANNYMCFATILIRQHNDIEAGYRYGKIGLSIADRPFAKRYRAMTYFMFYSLVVHWKEHLKNAIEPLLDAYVLGLETGDLLYAAHSLTVYDCYSFACGVELQVLEKQFAANAKAIGNINQIQSLHFENIVWQTVLNLLGRTDDPTILTGEVFDEAAISQWDPENNKFLLANFSLFKLQLCILFEKYDAALVQSDRFEAYVATFTGSTEIRDLAFYGCLCRLAVFPEASDGARKSYMEWIADYQKKIKFWAKYAPMNNLHRYYLVEAEKARVLKEHSAAEKHYRQAIEYCRKHGFIQEEALATECAAKYYLAIGQSRIASIYFSEAYRCYYRWGATAKLRWLKEKYTRLIRSRDTVNRASDNTTTTIFSSSAAIDVSTIKKVHSAIAGELYLENVLKKIMRVTFENAGAQRGVLMLKKDDTFYIYARGAADEDIVTEREALTRHQALCLSVVNYVQRTGKQVILNNASKDNEYANDVYLKHNRVKSLLCIPIIFQKRIIGSLYLENNLTTAAFTPERLEILDLILVEAAIAIKHTQSIEQDKQNAILKEEMEQARIIQTRLTPSTPQIRGYDITGYMQTAEAVGGDYYDVISEGDIHWLVIGDVTGHGLSAGLVMMMVQTAIHTAIHLTPHMAPQDLLSLVNTTITRNIQKLRSDKYMTINVFAVHGDGKVHFAGLHQDILVYRAATQTVECVKTDGMWIGIMDDIRKSLKPYSLTLSIGDALLLYTDGLTEVHKKQPSKEKKMDIDFEMFGSKKLRCTFGQLGHASTAVIRDGILKEIEEYHSADDITMLIVKRTM